MAPITAKLVGTGALKQKWYAGAATGKPTDHLECRCFGHAERGAEAPSHADQRGRAWQRAAFSRLRMVFSMHTYIHTIRKTQIL